jgi:tetratricopeptide (TPR) repeat protein
MKRYVRLKPLLFVTLLCGTLLGPVLADDSAAGSAAVVPVDVPAAVQHRYFFEEADTPAPNGKLDIFVRLSDSNDPTFFVRVLTILEDAGKYTRQDRAKIVADRLQAATDSDPDFVGKILPPVSIRGEVVLKLQNQATDPDGFIITADRGSMRTVHATSATQYANMISQVIKDRLKGIKLRDAKFDYQLTTPKEVNDRAAEYFAEAKDAYGQDRDTDIAISKCELALKLEPGFSNCRLCLADLYTETKQYTKAKNDYRQVADASDADKHDQDAACLQLAKLGS